MFAGYCNLDSSFTALLVTEDAGVPSAPDSAPAFTVYGPEGAMPNSTGTCTKFLTDAGLYAYTVSALGSNGFELGGTYTIVFRFAYSTVPYLDVATFIVT